MTHKVVTGTASGSGFQTVFQKDEKLHMQHADNAHSGVCVFLVTLSVPAGQQ